MNITFHDLFDLSIEGVKGFMLEIDEDHVILFLNSKYEFEYEDEENIKSVVEQLLMHTVRGQCPMMNKKDAEEIMEYLRRHGRV